MDLSMPIGNNTFLILALIWILPWKGVALWKSAGNEQKWWFIVILLTNTFAFLDVVYIFYFSKKSGSVGAGNKSAKKTDSAKVEKK